MAVQSISLPKLKLTQRASSYITKSTSRIKGASLRTQNSRSPQSHRLQFTKEVERSLSRLKNGSSLHSERIRATTKQVLDLSDQMRTIAIHQHHQLAGIKQAQKRFNILTQQLGSLQFKIQTVQYQRQCLKHKIFSIKEDLLVLQKRKQSKHLSLKAISERLRLDQYRKHRLTAEKSKRVQRVHSERQVSSVIIADSRREARLTRKQVNEQERFIKECKERVEITRQAIREQQFQASLLDSRQLRSRVLANKAIGKMLDLFRTRTEQVNRGQEEFLARSRLTPAEFAELFLTIDSRKLKTQRFIKTQHKQLEHQIGLKQRLTARLQELKFENQCLNVYNRTLPQQQDRSFIKFKAELSVKAIGRLQSWLAETCQRLGEQPTGDPATRAGRIGRRLREGLCRQSQNNE